MEIILDVPRLQCVERKWRQLTGVSLHATLRQFQKTAERGLTREQRLHRANKVKGPDEMGVEIERKFRIRGEEWRGEKVERQYRIEQGYLSVEKERTVRVRLKGEAAYLTVKGVARGLSRLEFEYQIPVGDAEEMLRELCGERRLTKTRFEVEYEGHLWEIDVFEGANQGLVVAEVELVFKAPMHHLGTVVPVETANNLLLPVLMPGMLAAAAV